MRLKIAKLVSRPWIPWAVLGLGLVFSLFAFYILKARVETEARLRFVNDAGDIGEAIQARVWSYYDVLYGMQGLFSASDTVTRASFRKYFSHLNLAERYPGFQVLSFARYIRGSELREFEERVRRDTSIDPRGYPDFHVKPSGDRPEYYAIEFIEPMANNQNALGFDIHSEPVRVMALERARDTGQIVASGRIMLVTNNQVGFSLRVPIYRNDLSLGTEKERRHAFGGVVSATFAMKELVKSVLAQGVLENIQLRIVDAGFFNVLEEDNTSQTGNVLFDSTELSNGPGAEHDIAMSGVTKLTHRIKLQVGGRLWDARFTELKGYTDKPDQMLPFITLAGGTLASILLFALIRSLAATSNRAFRLAKKMTEDLHDSNQRFRDLTQLSSDWFWEQDAEFRYTQMSGGLDQKAGMNSTSTIGKRRWDLAIVDISPEQWEQHRNMLEQHLTFRDFEYQVDINSTPHWFSVSGNPVFGADGTFRGYRGTGKDVTQRKRFEVALREGEEKLRTITDNLPALIAYIDAQEIYRFANRTYEDWFALKRDALVGRSTHDLLGEQAYARAKPHIERALAGHLATYERELMRNGVRYQFHNVYIPHFGDNNEVLGFFVLATDISDRKALEEKLVHMAQHDVLTELPNRALFDDRLHHAAERSKRNKQSIAVMYLDIDNFKSINDSLGHQVGDQLLKAFAARIALSVRATDTVARIGGDEFVVLLEELATPDDAELIAQKTVASMQSAFNINGTIVPATTSIGVAIAANGDVVPAELVAKADAAMYQAKLKGRNTYQIACGEVNS